MEIYSSSYNQSIDKQYEALQKQTNHMKQSGKLDFKIAPNKSGKTAVVFPTAYPSIPELNVQLVTTQGDTTSVDYHLEKLDAAGFIIHITNIDLVNEVCGFCLWWCKLF